MTIPEAEPGFQESRVAETDFDVWYRSQGYEVQSRHEQLYLELSGLKQKGIIPENIRAALDVGSGSGAGSVALSRIYPKCRILAVDSAETHQPSQPHSRLEYEMRVPPVWAAAFQEARVQDICQDHQQEFDLIVAARFPIIYGRFPSENTRRINGAARIVSLARMLSESGVLIIGYSRSDRSVPLEKLEIHFRLTTLFSSRTYFGTELEQWLAFKNLKRDFFQEVKDEPSLLLTEAGFTLQAQEDLKKLKALV
jgi:hypothetical protein